MSETDPSLVAAATDWQSLTSAVSSGRLVLGDAVARTCALACASALGGVQGIKEAISELTAPSGYFVQLPSGSDLLGRFGFKWGELKSGVESHERILTDMFTTLTDAGRMYAEAEGNSAAAFDSISVPTGVFEDDTPNLLSVRTTAGAMSFWHEDALYPVYPTGAAPAFPGGASDTFMAAGGQLEFPDTAPDELIDTENPYLLDRRTLYQIGEDIRALLKPLLELSARCYWTADKLDESMVGLGSELSTAADTDPKDGGWHGNAASVARNATNGYLSGAQKFTAGARLLADNLSYAAEWLNDTQLGMPVTPEPSAWIMVNNNFFEEKVDWVSVEEVSTRSYMLACRYFQDYYVIGIRASMSKFPILPEPTSPVNSSEDETPGGGETPFPPGGSGGVGSAGLGNSAYPAMPTSPDDRRPDMVAGPESPIGNEVGAGALGQLSSLGREVANGLQNAAGVAKGATPAGRPTLPAGLPARTELAGRTAGAGLGGGGIGGGGAGPSAAANVDTSKLFPRAGIPEAVPVPTPMGAMPPAGGGYPPPAGAGAGGGARNDNKYERPDYVQSREHLNDALGDSTFATKPVLEQ